MRKSKPQPLQSVLLSLIDGLGLKKGIQQHRAALIWEEVVGEKIAKVTRVERVESGRLFIHVSKPTWRNELVLLKREIIAKLNKTLGGEVINDIIFK